MNWLSGNKRGKLPMCALIALLVLVSSYSLVFASEGLVISAELEALPVIAGITQSITVELPQNSPIGETEALLSAATDWGVLLFPDAPGRSGKITLLPGTPVKINYRWSGATPVNNSITERVKVEIPNHGLAAETAFQVGVDIRITDISLPEEIKAGVFNRAEILVADAFKDSLDLISLYKSVASSPEISMSLVQETNPASSVSAADPVVNAFFAGDNGAPQTSYPSATSVAGTLSRADGGEFLWTDPDGRVAGITPPGPGKYHVEAVLKSNMGGPPLKHWSSGTFTAAGTSIGSGNEFPGLIGSSLVIMERLGTEGFDEARNAVQGSLSKGDSKKAIETLGVYMRRAALNQPEIILGRFAAALWASGKNSQEITDFLGYFVKGFGYGVLVFTKDGVAEWNIKNGAVYEGKGIVAAPLSPDKNIAILLKGSDADDVSMWKVIPAGTNAKKYARGKWIKEITVHSGQVTPPAPSKP